MASGDESKLYKLNVPKYLEEAILSYGKDGYVGKLVVKEVDGVPQEGTFEIDEELAKTFDPEMPTKYNVAMGTPPTHHLQVFSEEKTKDPPQVEMPKGMRFEGEIEGQMFVSSPEGLEYIKKRVKREKEAQPKTKLYVEPMKKLQSTDDEADTDDAACNKPKRLDSHTLRKVLLKMFAERPGLTFKEIHRTVVQPYDYLYKILRTVAYYHTSHHVWELKNRADMDFEGMEIDEKELDEFKIDVAIYGSETESAVQKERQ